eukprot:CAMPEP_0116912646 /NCGR_PEP_ID=MMETSP0467-20121206/16214_1 /TAXON_ID=283647 /ORGANISM="Mesodinium pulex, Strain SPMC105" /LENGTH=116 /DNA_ID=CAMNT_0004588673 /DNA_START=1475 /DNA_END=1825 /DNA_ORIENTATION=+
MGCFYVTDIVAFQEYEVEEKIPVKRQMPVEKKKEEKKDEKKEEKKDEKKDEKTDDNMGEKKEEEKKEEKKEEVEMVDAPVEYETKIKVKVTETKLQFTLVANPSFTDVKSLEPKRL